MSVENHILAVCMMAKDYLARERSELDATKRIIEMEQELGRAKRELLNRAKYPKEA